MPLFVGVLGFAWTLVAGATFPQALIVGVIAFGVSHVMFED